MHTLQDIPKLKLKQRVTILIKQIFKVNNFVQKLRPFKREILNGWLIFGPLRSILLCIGWELAGEGPWNFQTNQVVLYLPGG